MMNILTVMMVIVGYLSGSLCSAVIVCKLFHLSDPREQGSKNPGATNVLRLHGKKYAALVLLGDMLKGILPVVLGHLLSLSYVQLSWIGLACVIGHVYPLFFNFKGGKGVATALGVFLGLHVLFGLSMLGIWLVMVFLKRYSSLASLVTVLLAPFLSLSFFKSPEALFPLLILMLVVVMKHQANIQRLLKGTEDKVKF